MKACTKCNELNGVYSTECFKCKTPFEKVDTSYKKICPKCKGVLYSKDTENCEKCGGDLAVYSEDNISDDNDSSSPWLYVFSLIIPLIGLILGCIYIVKKEMELGVSLIITSIVGSILSYIIVLLMH